MSQIKLLHSGGNGVILAAPTNNPASDVTFKLPQADGTSGQALTTNASGQLAFATVAGGKILNYVTATTSTEVSNNSYTFASSGLSASITPSATTSKILVLTSSAINMIGNGTSSSGRQSLLRLYRGDHTGTALSTARIGISAQGSANTAPENNEMGSFIYLDSPNTTSSTTYTVATAKHDHNVIIYAQKGGSYTSSIVLLEVGA